MGIRPGVASKEHYSFCDYVDAERWRSYWDQIREVMLVKPRDVLLVGIGDGLVGAALSQLGCTVRTLDIDPALQPDYLGSVSELDRTADRSFGVVLCCQVLEHIPYDCFPATVEQLRHFTREHLILSLPYRGHVVAATIRIPKLGKRSMQLHVPRFWESYRFNGQHYWAVGTRGCSRRQVTRTLTRHFVIEKQFIAAENPFHLFFRMRPLP
ncbi:MAG: methyltransferase type 11 [bacterium]|nr:methyltransferase type 11 [bacterium]